MDAEEPVYRVASMHNKLAALRNAEATFSQPVFDDLGAAYVDAIDARSRLAWMPLEEDARFNEVVLNHHSVDGVVRMVKDATLRNFEGKLFGPMVQGAVRLFGRDPGRYLTWMPKGWSNVYRNAGRVVVDNDSERREVNVEFHDLPLAFFTPGYPEGFIGAFGAFFVITGTDGEFELTRRDVDDGVLQYVGRWSPRATSA